MTSNLTIMSPGGHRVVLKVNNNSPLFLALEEACKQFELESSWFGLKHIKRSLNVSATFRQSGVPNNATLELFNLDKERVSASVRIALQLQDGSRLMGSHPASDSLWEVVSTAEKEGGFVAPLCYPGGVPTRVPCLEYSNTKVIGEEELRNKTLKSLGIFTGSAIIRYSTKESQDIPKTISEEVTVLKGYHRSAPIQDPPPTELSSNPPPFSIPQMTVLGQGVAEIDPTMSHLLNTPWSFDQLAQEERRREEELRKPKQLFYNPEGWSHDKIPFETINLGAILPHALIPVVPPEEDFIAQFNTLHSEKTGIPLKSDDDNPVVAVPPSGPATPATPPIAHTSPAKRVYEEACPRDTCVFHLDKNEYSDVRPAELGDEFFFPTMNEVAKRQQDLETENSQLNDSPLTVQSYKKTREVSNLNKYDKTIVRVVLPNRLVLQGVFRSGEPVKALVSFIRESLVDPKLKFHLFTTPPKRVIKNGKVTFKEANLIPASNVFLALDETTEGLLLTEDLLGQVATQLEADVRSSKERGTLVISKDPSGTGSTGTTVPKPPAQLSTQSRKQNGGSKAGGKPKWLKLGK